MKRNKPETHFRLKPYLKNWIDEIAKYTGATMTSVVEDALEKGLTYRIKMIRKELDPNFLNGEKKQDQAQEQDNDNPEEPYREKIKREMGMTDEELDHAIKVAKTKYIPED